MSALMIVVLALRGTAAVLVLTTFVGGIPRVVQGALAAALGLWSALLVAPAATPLAAGIPWELAARELVIGATLGIVAAVPLLAAAAAGRIVDIAATGRAEGPYAALFGLLAAAVFVGIDGHVAVIEAIVTSHRDLPALAASRVDALAATGQLIATAVRLAGRASANVPGAVAVPAALVMMTASLVATLAVAIAAVVRHTL